MYSYSVAVLISCVVVFIDDKVVKNQYLENKNNGLFPMLSLIRTLTIIIVSLLYLLGSYIFGKNASLLRIFQFAIFFAISAMSYGHKIKLESDLNLKILALIHVISFIISTVLCLYFSMRKFPVEYIIYSMIVGAILNFLLLLVLAGFPIRFNHLVISLNLVKKIIRKSIPFGIAAVSYMVYMRMDTIMIDYFLTKGDVGIYALAVQVITISTLILAPIQVIAFPKLKKIFETNKSQYYNNLIKFTSFSVILFLISFISLVFLIWFLIYLKYEKFSESLSIIFILFFSALCTAVSVLRSSHITFAGLGNYLLYSQISALLINIVLNFSLIPVYGLKGAAVATLISQICGLILSNMFFDRLKFYLKIQIKSLNFLNLLNNIK